MRCDGSQHCRSVVVDACVSLRQSYQTVNNPFPACVKCPPDYGFAFCLAIAKPFQPFWCLVCKGLRGNNPFRPGSRNQNRPAHTAVWRILHAGSAKTLEAPVCVIVYTVCVYEYSECVRVCVCAFKCGFTREKKGKESSKYTQIKTKQRSGRLPFYRACECSCVCVCLAKGL